MSRDDQGPNPYVGLRPFDHTDSLYFFGRRAQVSDLLQRLHQTRFLAVVGSSGCGKSSLIRAGLIPALRGGFLVQDRDRWLVARMKPGGGPIGNLAFALCSMEGPEPKAEEVDDLAAAIVEDHVQAVVDHLKPHLGTDANLLLLLDQFEEIFAFRGKEQEESLAEMGTSERVAQAIRQREASDFVDLVLSLVEQRGVPVYVVLTMRSDFLGDCDLFYGLPEAMNLSRYLVPRLNRGQLREAIEGPALLMGQQLAPRLLDSLLNELGDRSDRLPILQHALLRTWDVRQKRGGEGPVDLAHYEAAGTLREALPRHANEALREKDLSVTARIFKCLTDRDPNHRRVRRAASLRELAAVAGVGKDVVEPILRRFNEDGRNFLVMSPASDPEDLQVEITHESLIRQWDQLAQWVDEESEARDQFRELVDRTRGERALLQDPDLQIALNWRDAAGPTPAWAQRYSRDVGDLDAALDYLERSRLAKVAAVSRRRRNRNLVLAATVVVGVALSVLTVSALDNATRARDAARVAMAGEWMERNPTRAALLLLEAKQPERTRFATVRMREMLDHPFSRQVLRGHGGRVTSVAFSPDGALIATGSEDGNARVWRTEEAGAAVALRGHEGGVWSAVFSPDGARLVTASGDGTARVWNADGSGEPIVFRHEGSVEAAAFSPDGSRIVTASDDGTARVWNSDGSGEPITLRGHEGPVLFASFSPDGDRILTGSEDGIARVWSANGGGEPVVLEGHQGSITAASFSLDSNVVLTGSSDGTARVWNADGSGEPVVLGNKASVSFLEVAALSPDGTRVVTSTFNEFAVRIWDADGEGEPIFLNHDRTSLDIDGPVEAAFSPDGETIVTGSLNGWVRVWSSDGEGDPVFLRGHEATITALAFSPDGRYFATGSEDGTARVWSTRAAAEPAVLRDHEDWVRTAAFSADGTRIVTASDDGTARVWRVDGSAEPVVLEGHDSEVGMAAFSPDGEKIVTVSDDATARVWNADGTGEPAVLAHEGSVLWAEFSPDGARVVTASHDRTARVWAVDGSGEPVVLQHEAWVVLAAFSSDGGRIVTASADALVRVWNADGSGEPVLLRGHEGKVEAARFSPDGSRIVTASGDGTARVWSADGSGEPVVLQHEGWVGLAAFSPDGTRIVTASDDERARVWNADGSGEPVVLRGHVGQVSTAAFSSDGTQIVTSSSDHTARVWNSDGTGEALVLRGHEKRLTAAAFSPDGVRVVTASTDWTARVWALTADHLQKAIAAATHACLEPRIRESHLDESPAEALRRFERCERGQDSRR